MAQLIKNLTAVQETQVQFLGREDPWRRKWQPTLYSCLENPMDRGTWQARFGHHLAAKSTYLPIVI